MSSLRVAVRVRPFNNRENELGASLIVEMDGKKTRLMKPSKQSSSLRDHFHDFTFDHSYWSLDENDGHFTSQEQVFNDLGTDVVDCAFQGYNFCLFAYGQTGSGKTYTMMGNSQDKTQQGLVPRICRELFNRMKTGQKDGIGYKTQVSYLEIYNERVRDLLGPQNVGHCLRVREHRIHGPYVENLSQHTVNNFEEIHECMVKGNAERTTAATNMNDTSSRSHAIVTITFVQAGFLNDMPSETVSKIHLVDLAGSERANSTGATGQRLKEGAHINKSLVTLGSVISSLAELANPNASKKFYIPYRDSTLTWLLKDSLGGNSKTVMLAAISPADVNYSETLSTLRYANRAKNIINKPTINEDANVKIIRELREEISSLRSMLNSGSISLKEPHLLEDLQKKEAQEKVLIEEWSEKWREVQSILREEKSLGLKKSGVGVTLDSEKPHLIGINDEITGVTLFTLKEGDTLIGTNESDHPQDIVLSGLGICPEHCRIVLTSGNAMIHPNENAQCWLNANLIDRPMSISQGDIILLGRTNMFRYNNPSEVAKYRKNSTRANRTDLSRLSLIAASRENLCNSFMSDDDGSTNSSPYKARYQQHFLMNEQFVRDNQEIQDEHKKILQTIESALKQLNLERVKMHDHFKTKVLRYTKEIECLEKRQSDKLVVIDCKIEELLAKQEMVLWEKNNEQTQELLEALNNTPVQDDYSGVLLEVSKSLDSYSSQYLRDNIKKNRDEIEKYENELIEKDNMLQQCHRKIEELHEKLTKLETENRLMLTQKSQEEQDRIQLKKQSLTLNLRNKTSDVQTDTLGLIDSNGAQTTETETCDTFHTANSDCSFASALPSPFPPRQEHQDDDETKDSELKDMAVNTETMSDVVGHPEEQEDKTIMSDSGVCLENNKVPEPEPQTSSSSCAVQNTLMKHLYDGDNLSTHSSQIFYEQLLNTQMDKLSEKVAIKKAEIMRILEMGGEKSKLDDMINDLQELQKEFVKCEMRLDNSRDGCLSDGEMSTDLREINGSSADSDESRNNPLMMSTMSTRNNSISVTASSMYSHAGIMTRSLPTIEGSYPIQPEHSINIPSYIIRGAGNKTHYEYEIRIYLPDERWLLLRRYSRFRELHLSMKAQYGDKVAKINFPKRELFGSNSESVAKTRRRQLETYLRRLLVVCSRIPSCPIYDGNSGQGLSKKSLIEFSSFFKKGLFESGKHGTG
ncbi:hypothetical protein ACKWTF_012561 [Chironomus riparius]